MRTLTGAYADDMHHEVKVVVKLCVHPVAERMTEPGLHERVLDACNLFQVMY